MANSSSVVMAWSLRVVVNAEWGGHQTNTCACRACEGPTRGRNGAAAALLTPRRDAIRWMGAMRLCLLHLHQPRMPPRGTHQLVDDARLCHGVACVGHDGELRFGPHARQVPGV